MSQDNRTSEWSLHRVFECVKDAILPSPGWPESELPLIRYNPEDAHEFENDMRYLEAMATVIEDRCTFDGARLPDFPQIESQRFWANWEWPDYAAVLLIEWKSERHGADFSDESVGFAW